MTRDVALLDGQAIIRAGVLAKRALAATNGQVGGREGGGSKSKDGGSELHFFVRLILFFSSSKKQTLNILCLQVLVLMCVACCVRGAMLLRNHSRL